MTRKTAIFLLVLLAVTAVAACLAYDYCWGRREAALRAQADLIECNKLAAKIQAIQVRPQLASDEPRLDGEIIVTIEAAAKAANIPEIFLIDPQPARRLGDSLYMEKPTTVSLRKVTMEQIVALLHNLTGPAHGLTARTLRLLSPSPADTGNQWSVELELSYLIYDPPDADSFGARPL